MFSRHGWLVLFAWGLLCPFVSATDSLSPPTSDHDKTGQRWALLVGIDDYAELSDLRYCRRDIEALRERLIEAGFPESNVTMLHDGQRQSLYQPFRANILHHLHRLLRSAGPDDLVLFAFSGHGMEADGVSYLCPVDAQLDAPSRTLISLDMVYRGLELCAARQKVLLIDACRNDPRPGGERSVEQIADINTAFASSLEEPPEGIVVLASSRPGQVSVEDDKIGHGVFMYFVIEGLRGEADRIGGNGDGKVSLFELYRYVDTRTRAFVARSRDMIQTPVLRGELTADFELGTAVDRSREVQRAWAMVRDEADALFEHSALLKWVMQLHARRSRGIAAEVATGYIQQALHRPEAILLSNPSLITAQQPEALLALQRAYAFGMRGDMDGVLAASSEAIAIEPDNPFAYLLRAMAHTHKASSVQMVRTMIGASGDPRILAQVIRSSAANVTVARQFQDVLRQLHAIRPELAVDLELARTDPNAFAAQIHETLDTLEQAMPLTAAVEDYERIGLGLPCVLTDGAELRSGEEVVGKVSGYEELFQITAVNGPLLLAESIEVEPAKRGWVSRDSVVSLIPYFSALQMVMDY